MPSNLTSINALDDPDLTGTDTAFRSVCALIRTRAAVDPDRIAVADAAGALTYAELVRRAGRLAARLRRQIGLTGRLFAGRRVESIFS